LKYLIAAAACEQDKTLDFIYFMRDKVVNFQKSGHNIGSFDKVTSQLCCTLSFIGYIASRISCSTFVSGIYSEFGIMALRSTISDG